MISEIDKATPVVFVDTGHIFEETLAYRDELIAKLGLTNIISRKSAGIDGLDPAEYRSGLAALEQKIRRYQPRTIALLGVTIFRMLFPDESGSGPLNLGATTTRLAGVPVFVLPNPSGRNAHYSYRAMLAAFRSLRNTAGSL
jgi:TDG/mug DNA glycosylase family protein